LLLEETNSLPESASVLARSSLATIKG